MKLAISNIAWANEEESAVAKKLQQLGVKYIEIAPTKLWDDPTKASNKDIAEYKKFWASHGIEIVAFQSMLFTRPDLKIFESAKNRTETLKYLQDFIELAGQMGARRMVLGSPKNRQKGTISDSEVQTIAADFFKELGSTAKANDVCFCIEPNPTDYACDFITNAAQGIKIVKVVNNSGFGLHLDMGGMTLSKDDIKSSITKAAPVLKYFHISSPFLEQVEDRADVKHRDAASALKDIGYGGYVSIEMKPAEAGQNVSRVERAVRFAQAIY